MKGQKRREINWEDLSIKPDVVNYQLDFKDQRLGTNFEFKGTQQFVKL